MKKFNIILGVLSLILFYGLFICSEEEKVTIVTSDVTSCYIFAGEVLHGDERVFLGIEYTNDYAMNKESFDDVTVYIVKRPFIGKWLGFGLIEKKEGV